MEEVEASSAEPTEETAEPTDNAVEVMKEEGKELKMDVEEAKMEEEEEEVEDYKPKWEINYDALYDAQDDFVAEVDEANLEAPKEVAPVSPEDTTEGGSEEPVEGNEDKIQRENKEEEEEDKIDESKPRWEVNYDALYEAQDDYVEEEQEKDSTSTTGTVDQPLVDTGEASEVAGEEKKEEEEEEEVEEYKPRWEVNYDALYQVEDDYVEEVEENEEVEEGESTNQAKTDTEPMLAINGVLEEGKEEKKEEEEEEEVEEYKPRWEVNYDALYEAQDDYVEEVEEADSTASAESETQPVVAIVEEPKEEKKEEEKEEEEEEEEVEEYKPRWEVNYDALYAVDDDVIEETDEILPETSAETQEDPITESEYEDDKTNATVYQNASSDTCTSDTTDTEVESIRNVILNNASEWKRRDSESSCNDDDLPTPTHIPSSPPFVSDPTQPHIPSNLEATKARGPAKRYGRRDTEAINATQKQKTDQLLESVQEKLLAAVQEEEEISSPTDSSTDEKEERGTLTRRPRESKAPERDILFGDLKNTSSGELSPIVEDEDEDEGPAKAQNDLSKLKTLIPGIAEIGSPGLMSPIPVCGTNSQERTSWGEWMDKFIPSYGDGKKDEFECDGDDEEDERFERDSQASELDSVYSEFDSEYASDDDDVIEYESYQEIEDNLFVMQAVKAQRPWADVDERDTLKVLRGTSGNKQETIFQLIELDKERCKLLGLE